MDLVYGLQMEIKVHVINIIHVKVFNGKQMINVNRFPLYVQQMDKVVLILKVVLIIIY